MASSRTSTGPRGSRVSRTRHLAVAIALALGLAACGGGDAEDEGVSGDATSDAAQEPATDDESADDEMTDDEGEDEEADDDSSAAEGEAPVTTAETPLGTILVTAEGMTLYGFTNDEQGVSSACAGECLANWPALTTEADTVPDGLDPSVFGVITRDDGSHQLTADGWPLYTYAPDQAPGDTLGQGIGDVWFVVAPDGTLVTSSDDEAAALGY